MYNEEFQDDIRRVSTMAVGNGWVGLYLHVGGERTAVVTTKAKTDAAALRAATEWEDEGIAEVEARTAWAEQAWADADGPRPEEHELFTAHFWEPHPDFPGLYQVMTAAGPCLKAA